jgi:hypothetical protein
MFIFLVVLVIEFERLMQLELSPTLEEQEVQQFLEQVVRLVLLDFIFRILLLETQLELFFILVIKLMFGNIYFPLILSLSMLILPVLQLVLVVTLVQLLRLS